MFAGIIIEGAIIQYDTNIGTGGNGARYLGIGSKNQWRKDEITVSLRAVLVQTGEVILNTMVSKTVLSAGVSRDIFRFIEMGTELVEIELGNSRNESSTIALMKAIESAVLELINVGYDRSFWKHEEVEINKPDCDADCIANIRG